MNEEKKQKTYKVVNIVVNVLVVIILVLALAVTVNNVASSKKGYTSMFGNAFLVCQTDSMVGEKPAEYADKPDGFKPGDLLRVKILSDEEKKNLEPGDIISFYALKNRERIINSHRIIAVEVQADGNVRYTTKGDNPEVGTDPYVFATGTDEYYTVIGRVEDNLGGIGNVFNFFRSSTGFLVCIVIPSFLVVVYFAVVLINEILKGRKVKASADEKAKMKEELLAELRAQGVITDAPAVSQESEGGAPPEPAPADEKAEEVPAVPVAEDIKDEVPAPADEKAEEVSAPPEEEKPAEAKVEEDKSVSAPAAPAPKPAAKRTAKKPAAKPAEAKVEEDKSASAPAAPAPKPAAKRTAKKPATNGSNGAKKNVTKPNEGETK